MKVHSGDRHLAARHFPGEPSWLPHPESAYQGGPACYIAALCLTVLRTVSPSPHSAQVYKDAPRKLTAAWPVGLWGQRGSLSWCFADRSPRKRRVRSSFTWRSRRKKLACTFQISSAASQVRDLEGDLLGVAHGPCCELQLGRICRSRKSAKARMS